MNLEKFLGSLQKWCCNKTHNTTS